MMEVTQATELCCQKIEKASTPAGGDERIATMNKERAQRIHNIMVAHIQQYTNQAKHNTKREETS